MNSKRNQSRANKLSDIMILCVRYDVDDTCLYDVHTQAGHLRTGLGLFFEGLVFLLLGGLPFFRGVLMQVRPLLITL